MKILWITNILLPSIAQEMNLPIPSIGGWMISSLNQLKKIDNNSLAVATVYNGKSLLQKKIDKVHYFLLPLFSKSNINYNRHLESSWIQVREIFNPDIIHIHGSEFPHGLAWVKACGKKGVIISLQGIISVISKNYLSNVPLSIKNFTFRDLIKGGIKKEQKIFFNRGKYEKQLIRSVKYIIGRTEWDKVHSWSINPYAKYYYCGETLRDIFYNHKWTYQNCEKHSIFISQASYPIKGFHQLIKSLPLIHRDFPDAKIYVAGQNIINKTSLKLSGYAKYLKDLINKYDLNEHIVFCGNLDEKQMCDRFLKSHVFVCPSSIENSPNSLGEAQILEMPYVASFVGGIPEIVEYNPEVLYRFDEYEMLAARIINIFKKGESFTPFNFDKKRYDPKINLELLLDIYNKVASN